MTPLARANALALAVPAALLAGAWASQLFGGLVPCEMCHWQRWPHYTAVALAALGFAAPRPLRRTLVVLAAVAIATSGVLGVFHAGVEYGWWRGPAHCTGMGAGATLAELMRAPLIRCDRAQWTLGGVSLAGFNALFSLAGAAAVAAVLGRTRYAHA